MANYVLGIDPGMCGAIALLKNGDLTEVSDIPVTKVEGKNQLNIAIFKDFIDAISLAINCTQNDENTLFCIIEDVPVISGKGTAISKQNRMLGQIEGVLVSCSVSYKLVDARKWKKYYSIKTNTMADLMLDPKSNADKQKRARINKEKYRIKAIQLFPENEDSFKRKKDIDRAEAALIGLYGFSLI